ncbi:hypothetical protein ECHLIB_0780 [Ehrlichia chaffeensis str. Liberty]|nr:hypothetical protein ECHJAX_0776 [Ehrlichia chaffeensis str. Jax]AHX06825.1 hypothetical protein ECHLIB_0780 [Ehrlichia chaffeensis str. Liberty]AHX07983.1 hypothetical protein ECHOSC_0290 [Ehrlichia chaffeensis str. Osceola]AHX08837.1 hypothetical protein ECHSTV_0764 [Ehrlichia chaffeensis str. Saint Vincent]AHX09900.1 hypothetical protein ECHWAK_0773 [Ehrlichia chaffeensis str. Wakulla]
MFYKQYTTFIIMILVINVQLNIENNPDFHRILIHVLQEW